MAALLFLFLFLLLLLLLLLRLPPKVLEDYTLEGQAVRQDSFRVAEEPLEDFSVFRIFPDSPDRGKMSSSLFYYLFQPNFFSITNLSASFKFSISRQVPSLFIV